MPKKQSALTQLVIAATSAIIITAASLASLGQSARDTDADVDRIFGRWTSATPGCTVGASVNGTQVLARAYGLADLEHDVRNTPETIFEAGSVSKQFTAAAVLLLANDGKLSIDDPARKYIQELPEYGAPLTIRQMLNHTSGLRDWGSVAAMAGWPRTSRVHTHAHVLDIVSRQRALNFPSGTRWSYSNTGYNLAAVLVSRVSGMSFADFTQKRIFGPLGMTRTSWRDDHRRVVKGRAMAYSEEPSGYRTLMPFENVHGNGGLLTTVGDLLKWNNNFTSPVVGDRAFVEEQQAPGRFNDGRAHSYALGLRVGAPRNGVREIAHSGSTAGYQAHLTRFPDQQVSVAVLCNASSANAPQYATAVADLYLGDRAGTPAAPAANHVLTDSDATAATGMFRNRSTGDARNFTRVDNGVRIDRGPIFAAVSSRRFVSSSGVSWEIDATGAGHLSDPTGAQVETYEPVTRVSPTVAQLQELSGTYFSEDAETTFKVVVDGSTLAIKRRPDSTIGLTPLYLDAFEGPLGTIIFRREGGRVTSLSVVQDRVWDLRFKRQADAGTRSE